MMRYNKIILQKVENSVALITSEISILFVFSLLQDDHYTVRSHKGYPTQEQQEEKMQTTRQFIYKLICYCLISKVLC